MITSHRCVAVSASACSARYSTIAHVSPPGAASIASAVSVSSSGFASPMRASFYPMRRTRAHLPFSIYLLPSMFLAVALDNPLIWPILIGWIISVILHEFAHGVVAHWGGDYTIKERGGLSLNPLQYIDPLMSIILPAVVLLLGGLPLPGGVTYVRRDLLRSRAWDAAVSAAGPAMNFLLFLLLSLPFHPSVGWITPTTSAAQAPNLYIFLAAMAQLQMIAVILNLIPCPPLDGFQMLAAYMPPETRDRLMGPPFGIMAFLILFFVLANVPALRNGIFNLTDRVWLGLGFGLNELRFLTDAYNLALFGRTFD